MMNGGLGRGQKQHVRSGNKSWSLSPSPGAFKKPMILLRCNPQGTNTVLKGTVQWFLVDSRRCATSTVHFQELHLSVLPPNPRPEPWQPRISFSFWISHSGHFMEALSPNGQPFVSLRNVGGGRCSQLRSLRRV